MSSTGRAHGCWALAGMVLRSHGRALEQLAAARKELQGLQSEQELGHGAGGRETWGHRSMAWGHRAIQSTDQGGMSTGAGS